MLTELLENQLHLIVFSALMILFIFLSLLLSLLHHVGLVLILLDFVLDDAPLKLFKGLPAGLLLCDAVVTDHIDKHYAGVNDLLLLLKQLLDVLSELLSAALSVGAHHLSQGNYKQLNASQSQVGLDGLNVQAQESAKKVGEAAHLHKLVPPLVLLSILAVSAPLHLIDNLEGVEKLVD